MAYCLKCGAYIPDGQSGCLACGYDPVEEQKKEEAEKSRNTGAAAARQSRSSDEMRSRLEEQRRRVQEQNRQWAEDEKRRRAEAAAREKARKEQQERDRQWAQEEYEKRRAEQKAEAASRSSGIGQSFGEYYREHTEGSQGNKALAAISYLSVLFAIPYFLAPNDEFARFHAKQGMKLFVFGIVAEIAASLIGLGWIATLVRLYLIYKGMSNALNGKKEELPWIGNLSIGEK